ncbi:YrzI family small protein [Neobacillus mesonae]|nr:YrzI family small protein [Neobacillus mesonae]MCM3570176.1 YrzI family small protein [Neobacillus mesonae]
MSINILFLTITFKKREISLEEAVQQEMVERLYEEHKDRQFSLYRIM